MDKKETIKTLKRIGRELIASVSSSTSSEKMDKTAEELIALTEAIVILEKVEKAEQKAMKRIKDRFDSLSNEKIVSIDVETNGLWGKAFAVAGVVYENGKEVDRFIARCPIAEKTNSWVAENVLPKMADIKETHKDYESMLSDFNQFLKKHNDGKVLSHMGHVVEAGLFRDMHELGIIGDFEAPYEWYDVCLLFGDSVDSYNRRNEIEVEDVNGGTHNPLYDCVSAYKAFWHFINV